MITNQNNNLKQAVKTNRERMRKSDIFNQSISTHVLEGNNKVKNCIKTTEIFHKMNKSSISFDIQDNSRQKQVNPNISFVPKYNEKPAYLKKLEDDFGNNNKSLNKTFNANTTTFGFLLKENKEKHKNTDKFLIDENMTAKERKLHFENPSYSREKVKSIINTKVNSRLQTKQVSLNNSFDNDNEMKNNKYKNIKTNFFSEDKNEMIREKLTSKTKQSMKIELNQSQPVKKNNNHTISSNSYYWTKENPNWTNINTEILFSQVPKVTNDIQNANDNKAKKIKNAFYSKISLSKTPKEPVIREVKNFEYINTEERIKMNNIITGLKEKDSSYINKLKKQLNNTSVFQGSNYTNLLSPEKTNAKPYIKSYEIPINSVESTSTNDFKFLLKGVPIHNLNIKTLENNKGKVCFEIRQKNQDLTEKLTKIQNKIQTLGMNLKEVDKNILFAKNKTDLNPSSLTWNSKPIHINSKTTNTNYNLNMKKNMNKESDEMTLGKRLFKK